MNLRLEFASPSPPLDSTQPPASPLPQMENEKLHAPASELAFLTKTSIPSTNSSALIDAGLPFASTSTLPEEAPASPPAADGPKKRKRKGPAGPNPLSIRKKKKDPVGEGRAAKKPRVDLDGERVESRAARGDGEGKRRKRGRGKKTKVEGAAGVGASGEVNGGKEGASGGEGD